MTGFYEDVWSDQARALLIHLEQLFKEEILEVNIPTGTPLLYDFDEQGKVVNHRYL